jgi:hypothetical protein
MRQCDESDSEWVCGLDPSDSTNNCSLPVGYTDDNQGRELNCNHSTPIGVLCSNATGSATATTERATVTTTVTATASVRISAKNNNSTTIGFGVGLGVELSLLAALLGSLLFLYRGTQEAESFWKWSPNVKRRVVGPIQSSQMAVKTGTRQ